MRANRTRAAYRADGIDILGRTAYTFLNAAAVQPPHPQKSGSSRWGGVIGVLGQLHVVLRMCVSRWNPRESSGFRRRLGPAASSSAPDVHPLHTPSCAISELTGASSIPHMHIVIAACPAAEGSAWWGRELEKPAKGRGLDRRRRASGSGAKRSARLARAAGCTLSGASVGLTA